MDTETRLASLEDRLAALETYVAEASDKVQAVSAKLKSHPLFGQFARMLDK